jgi:CBS domain-containing protein
MTAILVAVGILLLGLVLAYAIKRLDLGDSVTLIALLLIPLIAYGVASGDIREFTAPGGWGATFRETARDTIEPVSISQSIEEAQFIAKGNYVELKNVGENLEPGKPVALTLQLGRGGYYVPEVIAEYIRVLSGNDANLSVIIIHQDGTYFAFADGKYVLNILQSEERRGRFMNALGTPDGSGFEVLTGVMRFKIGTDATNSEALKLMQAKNTSKLVAVSDDNRPIGLVLRDRIVAQLLVKLSEEK